MHDAHEFLQTLAIVLCVGGRDDGAVPAAAAAGRAGLYAGRPDRRAARADPARRRHGTSSQTLAELGVILLMFSLGLEFSLLEAAARRPDGRLRRDRAVQPDDLARLRRPARRSAGRGCESLYAGAIIAISSTTIIVKAFEEQRITGELHAASCSAS